MRLLLAQFKHETNTFSPVPTPFERFYRAVPARRVRRPIYPLDPM